MRFLRRLGTIYPGRGSGALRLLQQAGAWRSGNWEQKQRRGPARVGTTSPQGETVDLLSNGARAWRLS